MDEQDKLLEIVQKSIDAFNDSEQYLIKNDLSERCICAKYAMLFIHCVGRYTI